MNKWVRSRVSSLTKIPGYQKPERYADAIRMDTNENLALSKTFITRIIREASQKMDLREYPTYEYDELRKSLGKYLNVASECIAIGCGSDQIIDLLLSTFTTDLGALTLEPSFTFYKDRCNLRSIKIKCIPLDNNFSFGAKKFLSMSKSGMICYICSPNNPTGNQFEKKTILEIINSFDGLVIVDEAYVEFAPYSLADLVRSYDNLVVLRTMSKAFGLAGARVGYMISNNKITELFVNKIQYPYPLSSLSLSAASIALSKLNYINITIKNVMRERKRIFDEINSIDELSAFGSDTNFILFEAGKKYQEIYRNLIRQGVVIRNIGDIDQHLGCLRVTIGTRLMNNKFLKALKVVCK